MITKLYHLDDGKSKKFWEITYDEINGRKYKTRFGKIGSEGRENEKTENIKEIEKLILSKIKKGYLLQPQGKEMQEKKKSSSEKFIPKRKPMSHEIEWEEEYNENLTPKARAERANTTSINELNNYDVVINENEAGYRNNGVFIYKDNELYPLAGEPEDYGSLPEWVEIRKEDCGHSYFSDYLIDNN